MTAGFRSLLVVPAGLGRVGDAEKGEVECGECDFVSGETTASVPFLSTPTQPYHHGPKYSVWGRHIVQDLAGDDTIRP